MARIAFVVGDMFEDSEFKVPYDAVRKAGHQPVIVGEKRGEKVKGKQGKEKVTIEAGVSEADARDFDALVIPGGYSPDHLRMNPDLVEFVRDFFEAQKPVAAICHAPSLLIEADVLDGRALTSWPSVKTDVVNAGGNWVDREVVEDGNLITSRSPKDLEAFCGALLRRLDQVARAGEGAQVVH